MELTPKLKILILFISIQCIQSFSAKSERNKALSAVHKFSIGKDFNSVEELDQKKIMNVSDNSIYSNFPPTISTRAIPISNKISSFLNQTTEMFTSTNSLNLTLLYSEISFSEKIKKKLASIEGKTDSTSILNEVINDVLSAKQINYTNITKGRSIEDTKLVLNYMLTSLYEIRAREQAKQFDSIKFFDQVFLDPIEISPDGLFEKDIVLSRNQALKLFSKHFSGLNSTLDNGKNKSANARKVIRDAVYRWSLPIYFYLDNAYGLLINWKQNYLVF